MTCVVQLQGLGFLVQGSELGGVIRITTDLNHAWRAADMKTARAVAETANKREGHQRWRAMSWDDAAAERTEAR
jgi:hypothetical protein